LTRVCEESKIKMSKIMMEEKLDGSSKLSSRKKIPQGNQDINILTLSGMVPTNDIAWLIDSGASWHMTGLRDNLTKFFEKETHLHVVLGDDARYNVRWVGRDPIGRSVVTHDRQIGRRNWSVKCLNPQ
jgi:hypothetical protein